ncbi:MAG: 3-hydroxyacyl-CoA dehydrogenase/enoyl-CoA hydratase family protein [Acidobacteria bacterium]|nr:3-hydroxyacyl-CoA dehydrogenase/enoyl-CoA hydratase family protein [Acidobacteriota bacterium]MCA1632847.1 3-hydroxyacyl-CoA dehydrogenase/enoyl-CoA hydratase family protein [Acidobacteriota bacterium]MCA1640983.1 3-hydroxyacyl-CoA dehydrogenase/enoyl-CoA hydratase family protein [Acidobacteriota bacterium]
MLRIEKAAVLGAGTMGAQIAAHLANAGVPTLLLDIVPRELTAEESAKGLTLEAPEVKNRIARAGLEAARKAKPAAFMSSDAARLVTPGNFEDDLAKLKDCDLVIEAVVENLDIKRKLFARVEEHRRPGAIVATNTSGIPVRQIAEGFSEDFRANFLGVHFFNPPRYLHLCELIPTEWTRPEVACSVFGFLDRRLGKGVVVAKDRPNFIANRVGTYGALTTIKTMLEDGYTVEEVDKMTGQSVGRAKSATFRTFDIVGLDVLMHVTKNLYDALPEDDERETFVAPEFLQRMAERGLLGAKTGGGFYRKQKGAPGEKQEIWTLDHASLEYRPPQKAKLPALDVAKNIEDVGERIKALVWGKDRTGQFLWKTVGKTLRYAANRIPEIANNVVDVDRAMRWGFNWELGVFETWDAIGVEKSVARMREEGATVPANVERMLGAGAKSFYRTEGGERFYFDFDSLEYKPVNDPPGAIILKSVKERTQVVKKNSGASLIDIGDGVACLEFHSKMNAIGGDTIQMIKQSLAEVERNFVGLVVGNQGANFCVGANLMMVLLEAQDENWEDLDLVARAFQDATMSLRYSAKPVVVAPFNLALGGGCEMLLHADRVRAHAETYTGLVEVGVGIIPAGGGTKEMLLRAMDAIPAGVDDADPFPFVKRAFETMALAKVSTSAEEARGLGYLREEDSISMNADRLIADAKQEVLALAQSGYTPSQPRADILAMGLPALSTFKLGIHQTLRAGFISEHDALVGEKLARILTGGDLNHPTRVSEQYLLDLEREAFLSLCGTRKTQERMAHTLKTGKPLRN